MKANPWIDTLKLFRPLKGCFLILVAPIIFLVAAIGLNIIGNNLRASNFANQLGTVPMPSNTEMLDYYGSSEKYPGRSECIIFGRALLKTETSASVLTAYFDDVLSNPNQRLDLPLFSTLHLPRELRNSTNSPQWRLDEAEANHWASFLEADKQYKQLTIASSILPSYLDFRCW